MTKNFIAKFYDLKKYFGKFAIVGISGIVVNQGLLTIFVESGMTIGIASVIAIEVSILTNFFLNNFWTWNQRGKAGLLKRFVKYHLVTAVSGGINWIVLKVLTSFGLHYFAANLIGIGIGTGINFLLNNFWTFKIKFDESEEL